MKPHIGTSLPMCGFIAQLVEQRTGNITYNNKNNNKGKELEKTVENQFLREEIDKLMLWKLNEVTVVIAALGAVSDRFENMPKSLTLPSCLK